MECVGDKTHWESALISKYFVISGEKKQAKHLKDGQYWLKITIPNPLNYYGGCYGESRNGTRREKRQKA